jgi:hypothetical protein
VSEQSGVDRATVARIRKALYNRYPGILKWQEDNIEWIKKAAKVLPGKYHDGEASGLPKHYAVLRTMTGRAYYFEDEPSPKWLVRKTGELTGFNPSKIKDYPIQGLATGDWVPTIAYDIADYMYGLGIPINTTHDDIEFDMQSHTAGPCIGNKRKVEALESIVNGWIHKKFCVDEWKKWTGTELLVPIKVKLKVLSGPYKEVKDA